MSFQQQVMNGTFTSYAVVRAMPAGQVTQQQRTICRTIRGAICRTIRGAIRSTRLATPATQVPR
jgi:hypothetical protein